VLSSVTSFSYKGVVLAALIKVAGTKGDLPAVTASNNTMLWGANPFGHYKLLQTGDPITVGANPTTTITGITVLAPSTGSPGYGRSQANGYVVARVTLADKKTALVDAYAIPFVTPTAVLLYSGQDASSVINGATWSSFGLPAVSPGNNGFAALGTLALSKTEGVAATNENALVYSSDGVSFSPFAHEGDPAAGPTLNGLGLAYASFLDPLVNDQADVAFIGTLKPQAGSKTKISAANNTAIWWGAPGSVEVVARLGDNAPLIDGSLGTAVYSSFVSTTLPDGVGAGPIFIAKLSGKGVTAKNNVGLFAVDTSGTVRQFLALGDALGSQTVSTMTALQSLPGVFGAGRSYNATGAAVVYATFTDKLHTQALLRVNIP
jgi:hypothetical protein